MKRIFMTMLIMLLSYNVMAQKYSITGEIVDSATAELLPFVHIALYNGDDTTLINGAITELDGRFCINDIIGGWYLVRISMIGHQRWEQKILVDRDIDIGTVRLSHVNSLEEVKITSLRTVFSIDGEKNIYNTADDPSIQNGSVVDALQNAPGIEVDAEGNIKLRGTQEVSVWINGRESRMNPEALKQYLKTMPASHLKRIEVITNPSARYGGGNPVVNIVTQGKKLDNQFVSLGCNGNSKPEFDPWISYVFNNEKWEMDLYANLAYLNESSLQTGKETLLDDTLATSRTDQYSRKKEEHNLNVLASADIAYHPDSLTSIYLWGALMPSWSGWNLNTGMQRQELLYQPGNHSFEEQMYKNMTLKPNGGFMDGIWYERTLDMKRGSTFMFGYYGSIWKRDSLVAGIRNYSSLPQNNLRFQQQNNGSEWLHCLEANCLLSLGEADSATGNLPFEFEVGGEFSLAKTFVLVSADTAGTAEYSPCKWLSSISDASVTSANLYSSLLHRWKRFSLKGGLRFDLQHGRVVYPDEISYNYNRTTALLTPSLHLTYTSPKHHAFALGYTYRTSAPNTMDYTARKSYTLDGYSTGNPLLLNSATHNLEMKWDTYHDGYGIFGVNAFYSAMSNHQETMTDVIYDGGIFQRIVAFSHPVNIGNSWNGGVDIHAVYRPNAFVNVRVNASIYYDYLDLSYRSEHYRNGMLCYLLRLNTWIKLWNMIQFFGNAYYSSPTQSLYSTTLSRKGIDLGVNADLFGRRLSVNVGVNDIFDWNRWSTTSANPFLMSDTDLKPTSRYLSFSVVLRFGQMELEGSGRRNSRQQKED